MLGTYDVGQRIGVRSTWRDDAGVLATPVDATLKVRHNNTATVTITTFSIISTGVIEHTVDLTIEGTTFLHGYSSSPRAAWTDHLVVRPTNV